ncbi:methionine ABC transport system, solute-binding protein [Corynebacterium renale]|uniref:MetQ/NlpA family ABC transporter substrate-binding protein n=1 Tax=Corynebacterium renale TaxID=1724 RepID=UPI000DA2AADE|nr:MetQ/NlpA family ABC transporter substrate-binding protein [Corynebacterium renale]SQG63678.1 methionine ABC transport system, solute-binding protein [Corynebacterium renale]STD01547.1 methionine ABC transport system, solute-binding protein [Corynebacterium renale]
MSFLKKVTTLAATAAVGLSLAACGGGETDDQTIRVATSPGPYSVLFQDGIDPILTEAGYKIKYTEFTDLRQADVSVQEGSTDLNVDQHTSYMNNFNKETGADLAAITPIPTVPAGIYSQRHNDISQVADGHKVGIPADASNQSRAFLILADAGWITLKEGANPGLLTTKDVEENRYNLDIQPMDSSTIPRALGDLDWAIIPGAISYSAKVDPALQYFQENLRPELILQAVVRAEDKDSEWAKAVAEAYRNPKFHEFLDQENKNNYWFVPDEIK